MCVCMCMCVGVCVCVHVCVCACVYVYWNMHIYSWERILLLFHYQSRLTRSRLRHVTVVKCCIKQLRTYSATFRHVSYSHILVTSHQPNRAYARRYTSWENFLPPRASSHTVTSSSRHTCQILRIHSDIVVENIFWGPTHSNPIFGTRIGRAIVWLYFYWERKKEGGGKCHVEGEKKRREKSVVTLRAGLVMISHEDNYWRKQDARTLHHICDIHTVSQWFICETPYMYIRMYVKYVHIYIYIHIYITVYTHAYTYIYEYIYIYKYIFVIYTQ